MESESWAGAWLARQCAAIPGVTRGLLVRAPAVDQDPVPVACWPNDMSATAELAVVARAAHASERAIAQVKPDADGERSGARSQFAIPLELAGQRAAVVVEVRGVDGPDGPAVLEQLRVGAGWLELIERSASSRERLIVALDLVARGLEQSSRQDAASAIATELAARLDFERVSIGFVRRGRTLPEAISGRASLDKRSVQVADLGRCMDEATDQDATVVYPPLPDASPRIERAHEALARDRRGAAVCTVPLASQGRSVGAITFERREDDALDTDAVHLCEDVAVLIGPLLELRSAAERGVIARAREALGGLLHQLVEPGHPEARVAVVACAAVLALLLGVKIDYRIAANATLEGRVQRAIVAGIDGYVSESNARAGDLVRKGQVLGGLDDRDLILEREKWRARRDQLRKEQREALAVRDRAQLNILAARGAQADAQLGLIEEQLLRTRLLAPFDGIVVRGDLSQSLGSPVERGSVLFEVAPLDGYRIILEIDEQDVREVARGHTGELVLSALPDRALPLTVERVTPVSTAEGGRSYFRAEAQLDVPADSLRPGMQGIARIHLDRRSILWIWTHRALDWARLQIWSWWP